MNSNFTENQVVLSPESIIRLTSDHAKILYSLMSKQESVTALFGILDVTTLLCTAYLSIGITNDSGKIVGAVCLQPFPNIAALPKCDWISWIRNKYGITDATNQNTLFIHLAVANPKYFLVYFKPMLQYLFKSKMFLDYAIMVVPPGAQNLEFAANLGTPVIAAECTKGKSPYLLLFCRSTFKVQYKIRKAVEEDNDDLVPLLESYSSRFKELYGDYYIAEILINGKEKGRQLIVAEYQGSAVACVSLNATVNYDVLNEEFELVPYNGLRKSHPDDYKDMDFALEDKRKSKIVDDDAAKVEVLFPQKLERETLKEDEEEEEEIVVTMSQSESDQFSLIFTSASMFVFQDDEESETNVSNSSDSETLLFTTLHEREAQKDEQLLSDKHADWISAYSVSKSFYQKIPEFKGAENAFALEIAASLPNHEQGIIELFDAAFDCLPDRDYCVMAIPTTVPVNKLTRFFSRVPPRVSGSFPFELYVMHRNAMLANIDVEAATGDHRKAVKQLLSTIPNHGMVMEQFEHSIRDQNSPYYSYVAITEGLLVGLAILSEEKELDYLKAHYDLSFLNFTKYLSGSLGVIESLLFSPIFQRHDKYFLREIHRLSDFEVLFYKHTAFDSSESYRERPLMNLVMNFLPVLPVMQPQYDMDILTAEECAPSNVVIDKKEPFALYVSTMPISSLGKNVINTKIVVVGCSHTALSFIQTLLFKQSPNYMVTYNNITLLCAQGLTHTRVTPRIRDVFIVKKNFWDTQYMDSISLKTYINLVQGKITKLDRKEKFLVLNNNNFIDYDLLFMMCGEQFQRPLSANSKTQENPENVIVINNAQDANNAVIKLKYLYNHCDDINYLIIVYGHFLQAHVCIHGLINYGIPGTHLVLIEPFPYIMAKEKRHRHNISIYNNPDIDSTIYDMIEKNGIKVYTSYYFIDWTYDANRNIITKARFESKHKMLELDCMAIFFFHEKEISPRMYRVINSAGLVYDGRLVINSKFQTNDPCIYGAGTLTKYSRKYYAPNMTHKYYNRVEIGRKLGHQIRDMLVQRKGRKTDSAASGDLTFHIETSDLLVPRYHAPILRYGRLPGNLYYLVINKPGRRVPLEAAVCMVNYGQVYITGNCNDLSKQGYFQLHLNEFKKVETITCLHTMPIDAYNLYCLWGKHEKLLNNLCLRFDMVMITDLFEYFKQPWAYAIYHPKFNALLEELNLLMTSSMPRNNENPLIHEIINSYKQNRWKSLPKESREFLESKFTQMGYPKIIENRVLNFLKHNLHYLPMYAHPIIIREILRNYNTSPLFSD